MKIFYKVNQIVWTIKTLGNNGLLLIKLRNRIL